MSVSRSIRRRLAALATTVALAVGLVVVPGGAAATAADADAPRADLEVDQVDLINAERSARGLGQLQMHQMLTRLARAHSLEMARRSDAAGGGSLCGRSGGLSHRTPLDGGFTQPWRRIAENVGCTSRTAEGGPVHEAFMGSTKHRENILRSDVDLVGVGTHVDAAGVLWTTQIFMGSRDGHVAPRTGVLVEGALASSQTFGDGQAELVVVGRSDTFPDLLGGAALAAGRGPVLFTDPPNHAEADPVLNPRAMAEVVRVLPAGGRVYLVGGPTAVSNQTERDLRALGLAVTRLQGSDRFATAAVIAEEVVRREGVPDAVLVGNSHNRPDAITGGNAAGVLGLPIVLVHPDGSVPAATRAFLDAHPAADRVVLGGASVVSEATRRSLGAQRVAGRNRIATSVAIAERFFDATSGTLVVGYGWGRDDWAPALAWSGRSIRSSSPQVLVSPDIGVNEPELVAWLRSNRGRFDRVVFATSVPASVRAEVRGLLGL